VIYLQVDVPMERLPIANWVLMAVTAVLSIAAIIGEDRFEKRLMNSVKEIPSFDALEKQLEDPRLSPAKKKEIEEEIQRKEDEFEKRFHDLKSPFQRFGLAVDRDDFHVWQLVTHLFVHAGFWHLFGNLLFLFCFGNAIDAKLGHHWFLLLYFALGIFAGIAWRLLGPIPAVGASGAIMGLTGVFLVLYPLNEVAVWDLWWVRMTGDALRIPSWMFIATYMGLDLLGVMTRQAGVGYIAHLAGEIAGFGAAVALVKGGLVRSSRGERNLLEMWGWVSEDEPPRRRKKRRKRKLPPASSEDEIA
jgi:membrane associated rhomboid family serine protease